MICLFEATRRFCLCSFDILSIYHLAVWVQTHSHLCHTGMTHWMDAKFICFEQKTSYANISEVMNQ
jgi:hypothetical protein